MPPHDQQVAVLQVQFRRFRRSSLVVAAAVAFRPKQEAPRPAPRETENGNVGAVGGFVVRVFANGIVNLVPVLKNGIVGSCTAIIIITAIRDETIGRINQVLHQTPVFHNGSRWVGRATVLVGYAPGLGPPFFRYRPAKEFQLVPLLGVEIPLSLKRGRPRTGPPAPRQNVPGSSIIGQILQLAFQSLGKLLRWN